MIVQGFGSYGLLALRLVLGIIFIYHSSGKLKSPGGMAKAMKWSKMSVWLLGLVEVVAGIALILGLWTDVAALLVIFVMLGALYHKIFVWNTPFYSPQASGWELDLALLAIAIALFLIGSGTISIDYLKLGYWP